MASGCSLTHFFSFCVLEPLDTNAAGVNSNARRLVLGKISDQIYNMKNFPASKGKENANSTIVQSVKKPAPNMCTKILGESNGSFQMPSQFLVTDEDRRYYDILCGLAKSQWKLYVSISLSSFVQLYL